MRDSTDSPNRSAFSIIMVVALGTFTPTSITVVDTSIEASPDAKKHKIAAETRKRLEIMTSTNDGFVIAEADMQMRGPGDIEGTMQR